MTSGISCNCPVWGCTCNGNWPASSGRFCHIHGTPHPTGFWRLWQQFRLWQSRRGDKE